VEVGGRRGVLPATPSWAIAARLPKMGEDREHHPFIVNSIIPFHSLVDRVYGSRVHHGIGSEERGNYARIPEGVSGSSCSGAKSENE
jgi:hypothetical protein